MSGLTGTANMEVYGFANPEAATAVELYTTSTPSNVKTKKDCNRLRDLLVAKKVPFVEVIAQHANNLDSQPC